MPSTLRPGGAVHAGDGCGRTDRDAVALVRDFVASGKPVVVDGNLITSRNPDDIPAFTRELLAALG